jgi:hypothetical protein
LQTSLLGSESLEDPAGCFTAQAEQTQKREALKRFSGLFVVPDMKTA